MSPRRTQAIIIGGGIAGLLAARVLSAHYSQVMLIERDQYPATPTFRPGTPQARHVHTMLLKGQRLLEAWFPRLKEKLLASGTIERAYGHESLYVYGGGRCPTLPPLLHGWNCSRLLLEWHLRQEVCAFPNVQVMEGMEVVHLLSTQEKAVCGVQLRTRKQGPPTNEMQEVHGDLVVDASGAASQICRWYQELGYQPPEETVIDADLGYATRIYQAPREWTGWKGIVIQGQQRRGGTLMEIEGGRWMVVLAGSGGAYPPTDDEGYLAFARSLPDPALFEAMCAAQPLSPIYGYRRTANRLRHFDRLSRQPAGLIVLGDALCVFNPVYGQGMTVAALEAQLLDACLRSSGSEEALTRHFHRKVARVLAFPWRLAAGADAHAGTTRKGFRYMDTFLELLPHDPKALFAFLSVIHMIQSPLALFTPPLVLKVLRQVWRSSQTRMTI